MKCGIFLFRFKKAKASLELELEWTVTLKLQSVTWTNYLMNLNRIQVSSCAALFPLIVILVK